MDKYPVTNSEFKTFLDASGYKPKDTTNFLKHWKGETFTPGQENLPVVYLNRDDVSCLCSLGRKKAAYGD